MIRLLGIYKISEIKIFIHDKIKFFERAKLLDSYSQHFF